MNSLIAWVEVTRKAWLRVVVVDVDRHPAVARSLHVDDVPSVVLVSEGREVGRIVGRTTSQAIGSLVDTLSPRASVGDQAVVGDDR